MVQCQHTATTYHVVPCLCSITLLTLLYHARTLSYSAVHCYYCTVSLRPVAVWWPVQCQYSPPWCRARTSSWSPCWRCTAWCPSGCPPCPWYTSPCWATHPLSLCGRRRLVNQLHFTARNHSKQTRYRLLRLELYSDKCSPKTSF